MIVSEQISLLVDPTNRFYLSQIGSLEVVLVFILIINKVQLVLYQLLRSLVVPIVRSLNFKHSNPEYDRKNADIIIFKSKTLPKRTKKK